MEYRLSGATAWTGIPGTEVGGLVWQAKVSPPTSTRTGYSFGGWFTAQNGGGDELTAETEITDDTSYYAKWTPHSYTVLFNANGGAGAQAKRLHPREIQILRLEQPAGRQGPELLGRAERPEPLHRAGRRVCALCPMDRADTL